MNAKMEGVRRDLKSLIEEWNSSRLELFHLTVPDEFLEFKGVMRFFFQDDEMKYQTKCLRVSSSMKTCELIPVLINKFNIISIDSKLPACNIYEHFTNSERILGPEEYPLLVQLNWSKIGHDGKFLFKVKQCIEASKKNSSNGSNDQLSYETDKCDIKEQKKAIKASSGLESLLCGRNIDTEDCKTSGCGLVKCKNDPQQPHIPHEVDMRTESRCESPPNSSFTQMISNRETAMQQTRQHMLESKLTQIANNGTETMGGALKIYGELVDSMVPYKTLLLSVDDTVVHVIRQALDKYGLEFADPSAYCLVKRTRYANEVPGINGHEEVLDESTSPLKLLLETEKPPKGVIVTFELRPRLTRMSKQRNGRQSVGLAPTSPLLRLPYHRNALPLSTQPSPMLNGRQNGFACLVELRVDEQASGNRRRPAIYPLPLHMGQICIGTSIQSTAKHPLLVTLPVNVYPDVVPFHLTIWQPQETNSSPSSTRCSTRVWLACAPVANETIAPVFVNGQRLSLPNFRPCISDRRGGGNSNTLPHGSAAHWLTPGDVIQLGTCESNCFRIWPGPSPPPGSISSSATRKNNSHNKAQKDQPKLPQRTNGHVNRLRILSPHRSKSNNIRPDSMDSTTTPSLSAKSDFSETASNPLVSPSLAIMESDNGGIFSDSTEGIRESFASSASSRTPVASRHETGNHPFRRENSNDSSTATSPTISTSGIGTCTTKRTDSQSRNTLSVRKPQGNSPNYGMSTSILTDAAVTAASASTSSPPLLDQLPCQLAYAPTTLGELVDWLLVNRFKDNAPEDEEFTQCVLGPAFTVYLMLRAICRQCDRWEAIENRKISNAARADLQLKQAARRQRELLALLIAVVDRIVVVDRILSIENGALSLSQKRLEAKARRTALVLSNISQLLHFISKDVDLQHIFKVSNDPKGCASSECSNAWTSLTDRVAELVESTFSTLLAVCISLLSSENCITQLVDAWDARAATCRDNEADTNEEDEIEINDEPSIEELTDPVIEQLSKILNILHSSSINPAFLVQLFARLLHFIGASLFNNLIEKPARVSPQWGRLIHNWIHKKLTVWADPQGLRVAVECYLTRLSQASDLMQASTNNVEGLYNAAVDLDRLNSHQVRFLLQAYRPSYAKPIVHTYHDSTIMAKSEHIPAQWVDFIISGVCQVSDRLLAEESEQNDWEPSLLEPLDLRLPLLLPEDCYPSTVPIRNPHLQTQHPSLSGGGGRASGGVEIHLMTGFLRTALANGWCRLSVRQVPGRQNDPWLSWTTYLIPEGTPLHANRESTSRSPGPKTPPAFDAPLPPSEPRFSDPPLPVLNRFEDEKNALVYDVVIPKIGSNLGLSIVAARSEDGSDLGIYVKAISPGGGASQARLLCTSEPHPPIAPGDRILAVDGQQTRSLSQDAAARLVAMASSEVHLTLARNLGLGCVAAAVPAKDLRKRTSGREDPVRRRRTSPQASDSQHLQPSASSLVTGLVRQTSVSTAQQAVEYVDIHSDGFNSDSPNSPRILVETNSLIAHEVPTTVSGVQRSRSWMSEQTQGRRVSVNRGSCDMDQSAMFSMGSGGSLRRSATIAHGPYAPRTTPSSQAWDHRGDDGTPRLTKLRSGTNHEFNGWEEMDVDATLEMLKEMRDQLDRSLSIRNQRNTPYVSPNTSLPSRYDWEPPMDVGRLYNITSGVRNSPTASHGPPIWNSENSAFKTTPDRILKPGVVRSASTVSPPQLYSSHGAPADDQHKTFQQLVIRKPSTFNVGVTRSNTTDRMKPPTTAIYSVRGPVKRIVTYPHQYNREQPITSHSFEIVSSHRRSQSADQSFDDESIAFRRPSVAERVKLFQNAISSQCK